MLALENIDVSYGNAQVLRGFSLLVAPGEITCLMGRNGAGKTTAMKAIMGLLPLAGGQITMDGKNLSDLPAHKVASMGIGYVPQGRRLFSELTVMQNIEIGLMARGGANSAEIRAEVLDIFPRLRERRDQRAQTLSGGEQQMLATARALCLRPDYLLLDEPTEGLQPSMIASIRKVALQMKNKGVGVLLVEQRVEAVLSMADKVAFIENGEAKEVVSVKELRRDTALLQRYVGV
ncbi:MAG: ABC transporter ATP-binding protein [Rhodobacteraceae bacterium]|nr:ABC transporter ATP-binding protein [Paracoccaceae bacterium]